MGLLAPSPRPHRKNAGAGTYDKTWVALLRWKLIKRFAYEGLPGDLAAKVKGLQLADHSRAPEGPCCGVGRNGSPERNLARLVSVHKG